jgi:hypothetical protein
LQARYAWYRCLRHGKFLLGNDPVFLPILLRLTPLGISRQITDRTELVVEGFPRSGNTFTVFALQNATDNLSSIASHVHHPSQVKRAVARGIPTVLVVREPIAALSSYLTYGRHGKPGAALREYASYHRELLPYVDQILICDFTEVVSDLSSVIARINERFSMSIPPFDQSPANVDYVFGEIERNHAILHRRLNPIQVAPRPSRLRGEMNDRHTNVLLDPEHATRRAEALGLYAYFSEKAQSQRTLFLKRSARAKTASPRLHAAPLSEAGA